MNAFPGFKKLPVCFSQVLVANFSGLCVTDNIYLKIQVPPETCNKVQLLPISTFKAVATLNTLFYGNSQVKFRSLITLIIPKLSKILQLTVCLLKREGKSKPTDLLIFSCYQSRQEPSQNCSILPLFNDNILMLKCTQATYFIRLIHLS